MAKRIGSVLFPVLSLLLLSLACAAPAPVATPPPEDLATRVQATLEALPTQAQPAAAPSATLPPSATPEPTATSPSATPTAEATGTVTPTETSVSGDPRSQLGNPAWRDDFYSGNNWTLGEDSFTRAKVEDGRLFLTGLTKTDGWRMTWPEVKDFYLEAMIDSGDCEGNDHFGLIFRVPDRHAAEDGYLLGFTCDGRYWLRLWDGEAMTTLVPLTATTAILTGPNRENRIGVWANGEELTLFANGQQLQEVQDEALKDEGGFGLFVGARKSGNLTIEGDEIAYWDLP